MSLLDVGVALVELGNDIIEGRLTDAVTVAKKLMGIALQALPVDQLKEFLTDGDREMVDLSVDVTEAIKVDKP